MPNTPNMTNPDKRSGPLTPTNKATQMSEFETANTAQAIEHAHIVVGDMLKRGTIDPRCAALAKTKLEEAGLWAQHGIKMAANAKKAEQGS